MLLLCSLAAAAIVVVGVVGVMVLVPETGAGISARQGDGHEQQCCVQVQPAYAHTQHSLPGGASLALLGEERGAIYPNQ